MKKTTIALISIMLLALCAEAQYPYNHLKSQDAAGKLFDIGGGGFNQKTALFSAVDNENISDNKFGTTAGFKTMDDNIRNIMHNIILKTAALSQPLKGFDFGIQPICTYREATGLYEGEINGELWNYMYPYGDTSKIYRIDEGPSYFIISINTPMVNAKGIQAGDDILYASDTTVYQTTGQNCFLFKDDKKHDVQIFTNGKPLYAPCSQARFLQHQQQIWQNAIDKLKKDLATNQRYLSQMQQSPHNPSAETIQSFTDAVNKLQSQIKGWQQKQQQAAQAAPQQEKKPAATTPALEEEQLQIVYKEVVAPVASASANQGELEEKKKQSAKKPKSAYRNCAICSTISLTKTPTETSMQYRRMCVAIWNCWTAMQAI